MRVPITINKNTLKTYQQDKSHKTILNKIQSDNLSNWDANIPKSLQEICVEVIAANWTENPIIDEIVLPIDRCLLFDILSTDLPLKLTISKINDDIYWKRCYMARWPTLLPHNVKKDPDVVEIVRVNNSRRPSTANGNHPKKSTDLGKKTWKESFIEMHCKNYLENLKPEAYNAEKMKELSDMCGDYVKSLQINELQSSENSASRIPLNSVLNGFQNLTNLSLCFKQIYIGEEFRWDIVRVPLQDIRLLAKGLEKCKLLTDFCVRNSDIDDEKVKIILKALLRHEMLTTLDFSHCEISDNGAVALSKFAIENAVRELIIVNNKIGAKGTLALSYSICHASNHVTSLNLKLNPIGKNSGDFQIEALIIAAKKLRKLHLNACGFDKGHSSIAEIIDNNHTLEFLDLSNNPLGEDVGVSVLERLQYNCVLNEIDVRMCKFDPTTEFEILKKIAANKKDKQRQIHTRTTPSTDTNINLTIDEDLLLEIENIFANGVNGNIP